jgi:uncharacterized protein YecE (DUF72 family)
VNLERLETFLRTLPKRRLQAIEFRDPTWYREEVYALLRRFRVALCLHDMHGSATGKMVVGPFIYVRFHFGTQKYGGRYDDARLDEWGEWLGDRTRDRLAVFAYFNNDTGGHAPRDAVRLRERIRRAAGGAYDARPA